MRYYSRIIRKYRPGEIIFTENSECDGMYIIDSGKVRVYKTVGNVQSMQEVELCTLGPKSMFGEMAMIDEHRRSASVQAVEDTVCTVITKKIFEDQLQHIPLWMVNMIRILVSRLRETNNKLREIIEQYTVAPADSGSILTLDGKEAEKVMEQSKNEVDKTEKRIPGNNSKQSIHTERKGTHPNHPPTELVDDLFKEKKK